MKRSVSLRAQASRIANNASRKMMRDQRRIAGLARHLAMLMRLLHGGDWRVQIDHETHFISIRMQSEGDEARISKANLREAV